MFSGSHWGFTGKMLNFQRPFLTLDGFYLKSIFRQNHTAKSFFCQKHPAKSFSCQNHPAKSFSHFLAKSRLQSHFPAKITMQSCSVPIGLIFYRERASQQPRMKRKRKGGRRRKRHSTSTCESGQQTSLFTRSYQGLIVSLGQSLARTQPPPLHSTPSHDQKLVISRD